MYLCIVCNLAKNTDFLRNMYLGIQIHIWFLYTFVFLKYPTIIHTYIKQYYLVFCGHQFCENTSAHSNVVTVSVQ